MRIPLTKYELNVFHYESGVTLNGNGDRYVNFVFQVREIIGNGDNGMRFNSIEK